MDSEGVGRRLREAREAKGWSRTELSRKSGVLPGTITKAESRASAPDSETLLRLALALGVDPWVLTFGVPAGAMPLAPAFAGTESRSIEDAWRAIAAVQEQIDAMAARIQANTEKLTPTQKPKGQRTA